MYKKCKHTLERPRFHDERNMLLSKMGFVFWSSVLFCGWSIWNGSISCVPKTRVEFTSFEFTAFIHKYKIKEWFYSPSWSISGKHIPWCFTFGMVFFIVARCQNLDNILACATNNAWDWWGFKLGLCLVPCKVLHIVSKLDVWVSRILVQHTGIKIDRGYMLNIIRVCV